MDTHFRPGIRRILKNAAWLLALWLWLLTAAVPVCAELNTIGLDQLRTGMNGYALSVFKGQKPIRFPVSFIDVVRSEWPGKPVFLIRAIDAPKAFPDGMSLGSGFSGSPIYFNGRLAGAFSFMEMFQSENILGVTPIGDMIVELEKAKASFASKVGGDPEISRFEKISGGLPVPGSMIEVTWVRGDIWAGASGTVTAVDGDYVLAFGHENLFLGDSVLFPLYTAKVSEVMPRLDLSHKITNPVEEVGSVIWDGKQAIVGKIGVKAPMIPAVFSYLSENDTYPVLYNVEIASDSRLIPGAVKSVMASVVDFQAHNTPNDSAIETSYTIYMDATKPPLNFSQRHDMRSIRRKSPDSIEEGYAMIFEHLFKDNSPSRIEVSLTELSDGRRGHIKRAFFGKTEVRPGDKAVLYVELIHALEEKKTVEIELRIPENYEGDLYPVLVTAGDSVSPFETLPESKDEVIDAVSNMLRADDLVVLHPGGKNRTPFFTGVNVQRTVKRVPWSVAGGFEAAVGISGNP